jgi:hypothetical protein
MMIAWSAANMSAARATDDLQLPRLDQQQPTIIPLTQVGGSAIGGNSDQILAQVVTAGITGPLSAVGLAVVCSPLVPNNGITVEVRSVAQVGGVFVPSATVLTGQVVPGVLLTSFANPSNPDFHHIRFDRPVSFKKGDRFAIVLRSTAFCLTANGPVGDPYSGGNAYFDARPNAAGVWEPISIGTGRQDLPFQTFVGPAGDHLRCYVARSPQHGTRLVKLQDRFGKGPAVLGEVVSVCTDVDKNGEGTSSPGEFLVCYRIKKDGAGARGRHLPIENQFGKLSVRIGGDSVLCVPSMIR